MEDRARPSQPSAPEWEREAWARCADDDYDVTDEAVQLINGYLNDRDQLR
jgi:hypothetical protein